MVGGTVTGTGNAGRAYDAYYPSYVSVYIARLARPIN
jgi:hypothetical protein